MPKMTPYKALSKRDRDAYRSSLPRPAPTPRPAVEVRVSREPAEVDASDRDGLLWLVKKGRLKQSQIREALHYRTLVRAAPEGAVKVSDMDGVGGGGGGVVLGGEFGDAAACLELYVIRQHVFGGEMAGKNDMLTAMDGVCGKGHTVRALAAGDQLRSHELLAALRIALNLMVAAREAKDAALKARQGGRRKAA